MAETKYAVFDIQIMDASTGKAVIAAGGKFIVTLAGLTGKATLYNPDSNFAALANPITPTRGKLRFAIAASPVGASVDIFGIAPGGQAVKQTSVQPGNPTEILVGAGRFQELIIPYLASDYTAASENDTGLDLPTGAAMEPWQRVKTTVNQSSKTLDVGLLSSESSGDADGFMVGMSLNATGTIVSKLSSTATVGALLKETLTGAAAVAGVPYVIGATAVSVSLTPSSGSTTAAGYICLPYVMPPS